MTKKEENKANEGRRDALKTLVLGAGGLTALPILGQAQTAGAASDAPGAAATADAEPQPDTNWKPQFFDEHQNETLIALTDLIIPDTDTPGAKAALANRYIDLWYYDRRAKLQQMLVQAEDFVKVLARAFTTLPNGIISPAFPAEVLTPLMEALGHDYIELKYQEGPNRPEEIIQALSWFDGRSISLHKKPFVRLTKEEQTAILEPLADPTNKNPDDQPGVKAFELVKQLTIFAYYTSKIGLEEELKYRGDTYNTSFPGACTHPEHQS